MDEESNKPYNKPGPKGIPKWGTITKEGIIVGRNGTVVPPDEIEHMASLGCTDREIAQYFKLSESTLRYNFSDYLVKGRHQLRTTLRQAQLRVALDGNPTMLIFLGKALLKMSDQPEVADENRILPWSDEDVDAIEAKLDEVGIDLEDEAPQDKDM
jgi:hypothetical protein